MSPHKFIIGTVTDAAKQAIESVGGSVEATKSTRWHSPNEKPFLVTLPSKARITDNNWQEPRNRIDTRWYHIEIQNITLRDINSYEDREGTLDLVEIQGQDNNTQQAPLWNNEVTA